MGPRGPRAGVIIAPGARPRTGGRIPGPPLLVRLWPVVQGYAASPDGGAGREPMESRRKNGGEDLNLWNIVSRQFDKAAATLDVPQGLLDQIKACNAVYYTQFPVRIG